MSELAYLQEDFAQVLAIGADAECAADLFHGTPDSIKARLAVYRGNVLANTGGALTSTYPVTVKIVGKDFFEGLSREYLRRHPSGSGDLNVYGSEFAEFVAHFPHTQDLPYLPDVARLEWLVHRAYYAKESRLFAPSVLAKIPQDAWESLHATLAPGCSLLESQWPIVRIWQVHQDDYAGEFKVDLDAGPERALIYRAGFRVKVNAISAGGHRFLESVRAGHCIAAALDRAIAAESGLNFSEQLREWVATGIIVDLKPKQENAA